MEEGALRAADAVAGSGGVVCRQRSKGANVFREEGRNEPGARILAPSCPCGVRGTKKTVPPAPTKGLQRKQRLQEEPHFS